MRVNTIRHSAWFAWRFPPGLSRCRVGLAGRRGERCDAAEVRERGFVADPLRVVAGGDQQDRGGVDADAVDLEQLGCGACARACRADASSGGDLGVEGVHAAAERRDRESSSRTRPCRCRGRVAARRPVISAVGRCTSRSRSRSSSGAVKTEMADLVQVLDPHRSRPNGARPATPGSLRRRRRRTSRSPTHGPTTPPAPLRSRRARRTCRCGDAPGGSDDRPRSPPHPTPRDGAPARRRTRRCLPPRPARAGRTAEPTEQRVIPGRRRRERLDTQHAAVRVDRGRDMHIEMRVDSARDRARALYDGHRHPFSLNGQGVARTSREGDRDEHAAQQRARSPSGTGRAQLRPRPATRHGNVATTITQLVDPQTGTPHSHWAIWRCVGTLSELRGERRRRRSMKSRVPVGSVGSVFAIGLVAVACGTTKTSNDSAAAPISTSTAPSSEISTTTAPSSAISSFRSGPAPVPPPCPADQSQPTMNGRFCGPNPGRGTGLGPSGECTGRETTPPCGPGMIAGRYYAYTLPGGCDGSLILDGRRWRSELPPPEPVPDMYVWVSVDAGDRAGFISPNGSVGFEPDHGQPAVACNDRP